MLVPNQLIEVKVIGVTLKHYRDLGYDVNMFDTIMVPPEHLTTGSHSSVYVICDVCGENIVREYKEYLLHHKEGYDTCNKCKKKKATNTCLLKYGVPDHMMVPEIQQKCKNTILNKYGVENISQSEQIKNKKKKTCMQNYGVENPMFSEDIKYKLEKTNIYKYGYKNPMQNEEIRKKSEHTNLEKYGFKNPMQSEIVKTKTKLTNLNKYGVECVFQNEEIKRKIASTNIIKYGAESPLSSDEIKNKIIDTNLKKYGVKYFTQTEEFLIKTKQTNLLKFGYENPNQNPEIKAKAIITMLNNGTINTSRQQLCVYETVRERYPNAILNFPFSSLVLDIFVCVNSIKIDIEYDGSYWHQDKQRDIKRDKFLQGERFKTLRIRSGHLLPEEQELFDAIDYLVNTEHHFKEIILSDWEEGDKNESLLDSTAV